MSKLNFDKMMNVGTNEGVSNEILWQIAIDTEDEKYIIQLYKNVRKLWTKLCYSINDRSGINSAEDWMEVAAVEFFLKWRHYDSSQYKFSTFIFTVIKNHLYNEVRIVNRVNAPMLYATGEGETIEDIFDKYELARKVFSNDLLQETLVARFEEFAVPQFSPRTLAIWGMKKLLGSTTVAIAKKLDLSRTTVENHYMIIRDLVTEFVNQQGSLNVEKTIRSGQLVT